MFLAQAAPEGEMDLSQRGASWIVAALTGRASVLPERAVAAAEAVIASVPSPVISRTRMVFVVMIALDQMGLGDIIRQAFLIIVAAIALGLALAFGLGGQRRAAELIEHWSHQSTEEKPVPRTPTKPVL